MTGRMTSDYMYSVTFGRGDEGETETAQGKVIFK